MQRENGLNQRHVYVSAGFIYSSTASRVPLRICSRATQFFASVAGLLNFLLSKQHFPPIPDTNLREESKIPPSRQRPIYHLQH